ncbi:hypothetical protein M405DRAFT_592189 [Rhizopogon salebrosus TDB-379]|nr:hypothetical protein M405DRAFT_592189 [Rhizopogon salebrosus TDB-379]
MPPPPHTSRAKPREAPRQEHGMAWDRCGLPPDRCGEWQQYYPSRSWAAIMPATFKIGSFTHMHNTSSTFTRHGLMSSRRSTEFFQDSSKFLNFDGLFG